MPSGSRRPKNGNVSWAIIALTAISMAGIIAGVVVAYLGSPIGAVVAIVTGAVGGIVAIVMKTLDIREANGE